MGDSAEPTLWCLALVKQSSYPLFGGHVDIFGIRNWSFSERCTRQGRRLAIESHERFLRRLLLDAIAYEQLHKVVLCGAHSIDVLCKIRET